MSQLTYKTMALKYLILLSVSVFVVIGLFALTHPIPTVAYFSSGNETPWEYRSEYEKNAYINSAGPAEGQKSYGSESLGTSPSSVSAGTESGAAVTYPRTNTTKPSSGTTNASNLRTMIESLQKRVAALTKQIQNKNDTEKTGDTAARAASGSLPKIETRLGVGAKGTQVTNLQKCLIELGFFDKADMDPTYGPKTRQAVKKFQAQNDIVSTGNEWSTGYGYVGPVTKNKLNYQCGNGSAAAQARDAKRAVSTGDTDTTDSDTQSTKSSKIEKYFSWDSYYNDEDNKEHHNPYMVLFNPDSKDWVTVDWDDNDTTRYSSLCFIANYSSDAWESGTCRQMHTYKKAGTYTAKVRDEKTGKLIATQKITVPAR